MVKYVSWYWVFFFEQPEYLSQVLALALYWYSNTVTRDGLNEGHYKFAPENEKIIHNNNTQLHYIT